MTDQQVHEADGLTIRRISCVEVGDFDHDALFLVEDADGEASAVFFEEDDAKEFIRLGPPKPKIGEDQLIDERDAAEEALSQAYYLITGRCPEWSNLFGHKEAIEEIDCAQHMLREAAKTTKKMTEAEVREIIEDMLEAAGLLPDNPQRDGPFRELFVRFARRLGVIGEGR